ncbi:hypothetical protein BpHYR1_016808 [Brachionus plicatilis]|uniref:Uncharacterized protein n=1 Tax=Brachionus plicatilis TaxID=10195 RepID=A0A3M7PW63_BRAPC|nr:hypothetical protein BpHYR1_016808 [Brachionus plicatilis]
MQQKYFFPFCHSFETFKRRNSLKINSENSENSLAVTPNFLSILRLNPNRLLKTERKDKKLNRLMNFYFVRDIKQNNRFFFIKFFYRSVNITFRVSFSSLFELTAHRIDRIFCFSDSQDTTMNSNLTVSNQVIKDHKEKENYSSYRMPNLPDNH